MWAPNLARDHQVLTVDLKGFGSAPKPYDGAYGLHDLAQPVIRLIQERDLCNLTLIGHSLGGGIALLTALSLLDRGELNRLRGLISIAGIGYPQPLPRFARLADRWGAETTLRLLPKGPLMRRVLEEIVYDPGSLRREQVEGYAQPLRSRAACRALLECARQIVPPDLDHIARRYAEIDVPTLLMWGDSDRVVPLEVGQRLEQEMPRARLRIIPRCGHLPAEERPEESLAIVREFLQETG